MSDLAKKHAIAATLNSPGWRYIREIGERAVIVAERRAIDEVDDDQGAILRRQAQAARKYFSEYMQAIEEMQLVQDENAPPKPADPSHMYDFAG